MKYPICDKCGKSGRDVGMIIMVPWSENIFECEDCYVKEEGVTLVSLKD